MQFERGVNVALVSCCLMNRLLNMGLDVGSTTVKLVLLDQNDEIVFSKYRRHYSDIKNTIFELLSRNM